MTAAASVGHHFNLRNALSPMGHYLKRPLHLARAYDRANLRPDLMAGLTVAVILLPQAIAFALIAELPPQVGLYTAIVGGIIGGLWGSSNQMFTGPANAISLLVLSALSGFFVPGSADFIIAAGLLAVMAGVFQVIMGMARLGFLVNFVSHSVIVGFTSGAGLLIAVKQLDIFLGIKGGGGGGLISSISYLIQNLNAAHLQTAQIGALTVVLILAIRRLRPGWPAPLLSMVVASFLIFALRLDEQGVAVIGQIPTNLPPLQRLPILDLELIARLSTGALAVGAIGLVQGTAITRSIAAQTGQRLDSNQEFVGQGFANILAGFFSGYNCAGSFSISAVNFKAGARSQFAAITASLFVLAAMLLLGPLTRYLPRAALAGTLLVIAYGMIDRAEIKRIWRGTPGDAAIMVVTLLGALFLDIEFAVLLGIMLSLALYIMRTSAPRVQAVVPDDHFLHFIYDPHKDQCPQLGIIEIYGDLYFGAVNHVEEFVIDYGSQHPEQRFLLMRMNNVNHIDFSGIHMLESIVRAYRDRGGDVYLVHVNYSVREVMKTTSFDAHLGLDHFMTDDEMIGHLFHRVLDPAVCIYECPVRVFKECQNLPKRITVSGAPVCAEIPGGEVKRIAPRALWHALHGVDGKPQPLIIDVREPREYQRAHIAEAESTPLPELVGSAVTLSLDRQVVFVCRSGRRSLRAAYTMQNRGLQNVAVLDGGMLAWEAAGLLEAVSPASLNNRVGEDA
jgi:sulfate permease, SulP family